MSEYSTVKGFALLCDDSGVIREILRDDFGLSGQNLSGRLFSNLVEADARNRAMNFLLEIRQKKISFDHRLPVNIKNKLISFYFIGVHLGNEMLIIGADNHKEAMEFTNHLQEINNEQTNLLRELLKKDFMSDNKENDDTEKNFDEITHLNNELVNLQRELNRKNAELERLNELKNNFMGMAAHDLRNPLGIILNYSEFLIEEAAEDLEEEHMGFIHTINESTAFMLNLVEELLDYTRVESGKVTLNKAEFDIIEKTGKLVDSLNTIAAKKQIAINYVHSDQSLLITADRYKIDQVLSNLIGNAIKFSYPGSKIEVKIEPLPDNVMITVKDSGKGIQKEDQERIFTPFETTSSAGTEGEKSTGLGLAIVKRIVEAHKGKIWLESEPGKGTSFFVELPVKNTY
ncbi:MAG: HAMP domain-containing histidine kinase [Bacteroidales bacterium]|nr:HAMP domain-containing histidine kinase [Bacteroidales bacterium]